MFKRIIYADWVEIVPYLAFFLTFAVFLVLVVRTLKMGKANAERIASLPLETQPEAKQNSTPLDR